MLSSTTLSLGIQPSLVPHYCCSKSSNPNYFFPFRQPQPPSSSLSSSIRVVHNTIYSQITHFNALSAAAAVETFTDDDDSDSSTPLQSKKLGVVVKSMEKPRLVLKFVWMEKNIGLALDQVIPGHGSIPLSPYYFWPRKDAWEELKVMLERKPWISQKQVVILLNQATDIINLWQQSGGDLL
ncbi:30S ribosomal protein 3, chloroplastic [Heracleum sosnowskyi]|uniref:30S ribosomal protein 3, chloroplastic n=1 Tax=Heracleum sosnowskyi TaxID=360622 RepID=A0AAD8M2V1_9APIA|nr:30S ribosomal protein 3, chloroplastic [Heracleum sosnowskyi]